MEGISDSTTRIAPPATNAFEKFVIDSFSDLKQAVANTDVLIRESVNDLAESIAYVANVTVTKEEFTEGLKQVKIELRQDIASAEHRIKSYIDDKVVAQNLIPVIQKEDKKINSIIDSLEENSVFSSTEAEYLKQQGPFPQLA